MRSFSEPITICDRFSWTTELVVQDAASYQKLLEAKERMEAIRGIRRGLDSMKRNGKPAEKFFTELSLRKAFRSASDSRVNKFLPSD